MSNFVQILANGDISGFTWLLLFCGAFTGGVIASVSPCSIAMLPLMIGYVGGCSKETPFRTFIQLLCFILGTAVVFTIIGIICAVTGSVFASALGGYFTLMMASLLLVIGLKITDILDFEIPVIIKSMPQNNTNSLVLYPLLLGIAFALAGTPCSTPILAGIMVFAAIGKNLAASVIMLFLFAIGQGIILILAGIFTSTIKNIKKFSNITDKFVKLSGWLIILVSIYLYYRVFIPLI
jgi:cytochrome c-type biogenesis protein